MKKTVLYGAALSALVVSAILLAACSTGSGSSDDPTVMTTNTTETTTPATTAPMTTTPVTPTTPTTPANTVIEKPTLSDLVGTWKMTEQSELTDTNDKDGDNDTTESAGVVTSVDTYTIAANGSYTLVYNRHYEMTVCAPYDESSGEKGTLTLTNGRYKKTIDATFYDSNSQTTNLSAVVWEPVESATASEIEDELTLIDGKFYLWTYRREGTGNGIDGTWSHVYISSEYDEDGVKSSIYIKTKLEFSGTTENVSTYTSNTGTFSDPVHTESKVITDKGDGTYTITQYNGVQAFFAAGNVLVFATNGWTKQ